MIRQGRGCRTGCFARAGSSDDGANLGLACQPAVVEPAARPGWLLFIFEP